MKYQYSDEIINAYVDDELDAVERENLKQAMANDAELSDRIHALCELKRTVKCTYESLPGADASTQKYRPVKMPAWQQSIAAAILLFLGILFGWQGHDHLDNRPLLQDTRWAANNTLHGLKLTPVSLKQSNKIVLHIASADSDKLETAVRQIEHILKQYKKNDLDFDLEVLANAGGLKLLRNDVSPYRREIESIMTENKNVTLIACSNALQRLREQGIEPRLIADTKTGVTAVEQIVKRLQQGWVYIKV